MVSAQQTNLLPENASRNDTIFAQKSTSDICNHFAIPKFLWLRNHHGLRYIHSTVGRSIADIYGPRQNSYRGTKHRGKYAAEVVYRGYRAT